MMCLMQMQSGDVRTECRVEGIVNAVQPRLSVLGLQISGVRGESPDSAMIDLLAWSFR
jgi:hypothetical protein